MGVPAIKQRYFCTVYNCGKGLLESEEKIRGNHAFFRDIITLNLGKKSHTLLCIVMLLRIIGI